MKTRRFVRLLVLVVSALALSSCNTILGWFGRGDIVIDDFEMDSTVTWTTVQDDAVSISDQSWGCGVSRALDEGPVDFSKVESIWFQLHANGGSGDFNVQLVDADGTIYSTSRNATDHHLSFSGSGWMEFNIEMKDLAVVDWSQGSVPGFDLARVQSFELIFEHSSATVYLDDIAADWRLFGPR